MRATAEVIDRASVYICFATGVPGNIFIFLTVRSFPNSVASFHFKILAVMDMTALCLQLSIRAVDWYDLASISSSYVGVGWKIYFNIAYFTSIYANWVLVYIATERLIYLRYPSQIHIYLTVPRAKANVILTAFLMASFCGIVIVKMDYFAIAWLVVYTTFYTAFPLGIVFLIIWLLLGTMTEHRQQKKILQKEKEKHNHHNHHNKEAHKTTTSGPTPTDSGSQTTAGSNTSTGTPTMSKSTSGLSKHSAGPLISKHEQHSTHPVAPTNQYAMTLSFTANANKKLENITPETEPESEEILTRKAKEKKDLERCYTYMMLALSVTFVLLTVPYTVIEYIYVASNGELTDIFDEKQSRMYLLIIIALCLMYVEHSCNFYVFFLCSWRFRQQFIRVITRKTSTSIQDGPNDFEQTKSFV